jgi:hypothetical protein
VVVVLLSVLFNAKAGTMLTIITSAQISAAFFGIFTIFFTSIGVVH